MADPVQIRAKDKRLAEALRANLRRRKNQARDRAAMADGEHVSDAPADLTAPSDPPGAGEAPQK